SFVEGAQIATHVLLLADKGIALVAAGAAGLASKPTPGLAVPALSELSFENTPAVLWAIPSARLSDIALAARLACASPRLGAPRLRDGGGSRQSPQAIRPVDRSVPGGPAQARRLPHRPGRRTAHHRVGRRRARPWQPRLAFLRRRGIGICRPGAPRSLGPDPP